MSKILWSLVVFSSIPAWAQTAGYMGKVEFGGFGGFSGGLGRIAGGYGLSGGVAPFKNFRGFMPYGEFTYFPGISSASRVEQGSVVDQTSSQTQAVLQNIKVGFADFHGGIHLRQEIAGSRVAWYPSIGVGVLRAGSFPFTSPLTQRQFTIGPFNDLAVNGGGGIRYYVGEKWGIRFEAKVYKPMGKYPDPFFKAIVGFFWYAK